MRATGTCPSSTTEAHHPYRDRPGLFARRSSPPFRDRRGPDSRQHRRGRPRAWMGLFSATCSSHALAALERSLMALLAAENTPGTRCLISLLADSAMHRNLLILVFVLGYSFASFPINAQNSSPVSTPTPSKPQATPDRQPPVPAAGDPLYAPVVTSRGPQSLHERFMAYAIVTVGPRSLFVPPVYAAIRMADPPSAYPRDWRLGAGAFGRNYGNALASRASLETGRFLTGALLHEDFRYRPSTSKNPLVRAFTRWHLLSSTNRIPSTTELRLRISLGREPVDSWAICICPRVSTISAMPKLALRSLLAASRHKTCCASSYPNY